MKSLVAVLFFLTFLYAGPAALLAEPAVSDATEECLNCHATINPGIVQDWKKSRHAQLAPATGMAVQGFARKVSSKAVPEELKDVVVGCAECHTANPNTHADTFEHNGYDIHVVVSPRDCSTCHAQETEQYPPVSAVR